VTDGINRMVLSATSEHGRFAVLCEFAGARPSAVWFNNH
jgi:hypothetical protein